MTALFAVVVWSALAGLIVLSLTLFARFCYLSARDYARVEVEFADTLAAVRRWVESCERSRGVSGKHRTSRHRPAGDAESRPAVDPAVSSEPAGLVVGIPRPWTALDANRLTWPTQPVHQPPQRVRGTARVPIKFDSAWDAFNLARAMLRGDTGRIPAVRDEVGR